MTEELNQENNEALQSDKVLQIAELEDNILNSKNYRFHQEGQLLVCEDNPNLSGLLPLGTMIEGTPGNYKITKIF